MGIEAYEQEATASCFLLPFSRFVQLGRGDRSPRSTFAKGG